MSAAIDRRTLSDFDSGRGPLVSAFLGGEPCLPEIDFRLLGPRVRLGVLACEEGLGDDRL